jgi:hypothetical protein
MFEERDGSGADGGPEFPAVPAPIVQPAPIAQPAPIVAPLPLDAPDADVTAAHNAELVGHFPVDVEAALAAAAAGAAGWQGVRLVALVDPAGLSPAAQVDALVVLERSIAWLQGLQQQHLHAIAVDSAAADPEVAAKQWIGKRSRVR